MTVSEIIKPGDKIDIRYIQRIESSAKDGEPAKIYKSQVLDVLENDALAISMPSESGKLILLPLGARFELVFYSMGSLYRAVGLIRERYKKENIYMLEIELKSQLEKFQRREYYRYACLLDMNYYLITEEEARLDTAEEVFLRIQGNGFKERERSGRIVDLSGGGSRFSTESELEPGQHLLLWLHLKNEHLDKRYYIVGSVISCVRIENVSEKRYEIRVKFMIKDDKVREEIIRYIFEEERRTRQKEKR